MSEEDKNTYPDHLLKAVGDAFGEVFEETPTDEDPVDQAAYMADVDQRIEILIHYRQLLASELFSTRTRGGQIVQREVREFIRTRCRKLVGIKAAEDKRDEAMFSPLQLQALRLWADKLADKPGFGAEAPRSPVVQPTEAPVVRVAVVPATDTYQDAEEPQQPQARRGRPPKAKPQQPPAAPRPVQQGGDGRVPFPPDSLRLNHMAVEGESKQIMVTGHTITTGHTE